MKVKIFVLVISIIAILQISFASPCPGSTPTCDFGKAYPGRFCYQGEDITDIILAYYTIGNKFYLPKNTKILGCKYWGVVHHCGNTATSMGWLYKKFSISEGGTITYITSNIYNISSGLTESYIVNVMKNWVWPSYESYSEAKDTGFEDVSGKISTLPIITNDINSSKLNYIKNYDDNDLLEDLVIYEILNNTANRLSLEEGVTATYSVPATSYGILTVNNETVNTTKIHVRNAINENTNPKPIPINLTMIPSVIDITKKSELENFLKLDVPKQICSEKEKEINISCSYEIKNSKVYINITNTTNDISTIYWYDITNVTNYLEEIGDIYIKIDKYYIALEQVFTQFYDEGIVTVTQEITVDTSEAEGVIVTNTLDYTIGPGFIKKIIKLFW